MCYGGGDDSNQTIVVCAAHITGGLFDTRNDQRWPVPLANLSRRLSTEVPTLKIIGLEGLRFF